MSEKDQKPDSVKEAKEVLDANVKVTDAAEKVNQKEKK